MPTHCHEHVPKVHTCSDDLHLNTKHHNDATAKKCTDQYNRMDVCRRKQLLTLRSHHSIHVNGTAQRTPWLPRSVTGRPSTDVATS
jgi:hypothetical protein